MWTYDSIKIYNYFTGCSKYRLLYLRVIIIVLRRYVEFRYETNGFKRKSIIYSWLLLKKKKHLPQWQNEIGLKTAEIEN